MVVLVAHDRRLPIRNNFVLAMGVQIVQYVMELLEAQLTNVIEFGWLRRILASSATILLFAFDFRNMVYCIRVLLFQLDNSLVPDGIAIFVPLVRGICARIVKQPLLLILNFIRVHPSPISLGVDDRCDPYKRLLELLV